MTVVINTNQHGILALNHLDRLEDSLGETLPTEYRAFLIENNGACLTPDEIIFPGKHEPYTLLDCMLGLHDAPESIDIVRKNVEFLIPEDALPIAEDHGGDLICIGLRGVHRGRIFYWQHDYSRPGVVDGDWHGMILLAESFNEFVASMGRPQPGWHSQSAKA